MANKQINELTEITSVDESDLLVVYDVDEAGTEKTKKILTSWSNIVWFNRIFTYFQPLGFNT